ncbi:Trp biosynthesis-associated membrane protein [Pseudolysinimonas sp.]|jgi:hypothetical protein|uniref:Trp biosynthesis-associated membrane protein n=1 Tax=Pseudolysinimonas sp. TaxID=2680009 RepID=UPI0037846F3E
MTPSRLRLLALFALAVPILLTAIASGESAAFGALALASAAGGFAMLLAGPVFRIILSVLIALLGACVVLVAVVTPESSGLEALALVAGVLQVLAGGWVATTVRRWPTGGSKYSRTRLDGDPASDWDSLSAGDDPTDDR